MTLRAYVDAGQIFLCVLRLMHILDVIYNYMFIIYFSCTNKPSYYLAIDVVSNAIIKFYCEE